METSFTNGEPSHNSTLSRADKALVKRNVHRSAANPSILLNNGNNKNSLPSKPKKQPRGYGFWALVFALCIIAIANFFLTITIFSILRLTKSMESIEVLPGANLIKFFGDFEMDKVIKADGIISGFSQSPVQITSQGSDIHIQVDNALDPGLSPLLNVGQDLVEFLNIDSFDMYEPKKTPKSSAFSTTFPNFGLPKGVQSLHVKKASVSRITSALNDPLSLQSDSSIRLRGNEGLRIKGKELLFRADQNLHLRSINGSIILDSYDGVSLDVASLGISPTKHDLDSEEIPEKAVAEYKMCICMPQGVLFRIPVLEGTDTIHCDSIDLNEDNPCM